MVKGLFAAQRIKIIMETMQKYKSVDVATLSELLSVSDVTVRKDLDKLEKEGFLIKNHGGAVIVDKQIEGEEQKLVIENPTEKELIAKLAYTLIEDGDSIFLGAGSTCYTFASQLKKKKDITVITNNINALNELSSSINRIILIGGEVINNNGIKYSIGQATMENLKGVFVNKSIMSVEGVDFMAGFTVNDEPLSYVLKHIIKISKQVIFLADHTKFDKIGLYQIAPIDFPHCVISNERVGDKYKQYFYGKDIKMLTAFNPTLLGKRKQESL